MGNLDLWTKLGKTDPKHTKSFKRAGGFGGTAIKPIYTEHKMTEEFGPCGLGWGISEPVFHTLPASEGQIAVYCHLSIWYKLDGEVSHPVFGVGGDMVVVKQSSGLRTDDEAFKKAFTDAVGNAMKHIGMSADVHMGLFDDSKYVSERNAEEAEARKPPEMPQQRQNENVDYVSLIRASKDIDELKARFEIAYKSTGDSAKKKEFKEVYDARKQSILSEPAGYVPPSFDSLPEEAQQMVKNMSAG